MVLWMYRMSFSAIWCVCVLEREPSLLPRTLHASEEGYTESYIICPGAIVGTATGPIPSASFFYHVAGCHWVQKGRLRRRGLERFLYGTRSLRVSIPAPSWAILIITS